ncbi:LOW QUALITY PROTEIN: hypothetical protein Cgig2_006863 [Carnegiea gigantea]|uniref:RNase H type-1 domain-containing protein n=1 Tax=Carnegiea gigantea TaxID=171969 RepID=A0A9Q1JVP3_9CARY|nr:LOW QUALITY PROTEIN: hypothetical protein Cgig2_006863 [Carnegiea gigantea]
MAKTFQFGATPSFRNPSLFVPSHCRVQLTIRSKWPTLSIMNWVAGKKTSFAASSIPAKSPPFSMFLCAALGPWTSSSATSLRMFTVRSAYFLARAIRKTQEPSSSSLSSSWKKIWTLNVPSRIKLFGWKLSAGALPTYSNLGCCQKNFNMSCSICGVLEDTSSHTFLQCLLIWNSRNCFIFGSPDRSSDRLASRAIAFIKGYHVAKLTPPSSNFQESLWRPPDSGLRKRNFDAGKLQEWGSGLGFVVRDSLGDIVLAGSKQEIGFHGVEVAEAEACLFGLKEALQVGLSSIIIKGDSLSVITKLRNKSSLHSVLEILCTIARFSFHTWSCVKKGWNRVAHKAAPLQPYDSTPRVWKEDMPTSLTDMASDGMSTYLNNTLI